jgi:hypothetical protein
VAESPDDFGMFDRKSAQRISATVKKAEADAARLPRRIGVAQADRSIWAKLTSASLSGVWKHAWTEQVRTVTGFAGAVNAGTASTSSNFAVNPDGSRMPDNTVALLRSQLLADGTCTFTAITPPPGVHFAVTCATNSGSFGDSSNRATLTYNITPVGGGGTIGANLTPEMSPARIVACTVTAGGHGAAYFNGTNVALAWVNELADSEKCT